MKIVEINCINYSSTGNIMLNIAKLGREAGLEIYTCCKNSRRSQMFKCENHVYIGYRLERIISEQLSYITGLKDNFNFIGTFLFIKKLKEIKPDLIHLHVIHDTYINLDMLFKCISKNNIPVIYTFHDAWGITGGCPHFENIGCDKWKDGCYNCAQYKSYPESYIFDTSKMLWNKKKKWLNSINDLTIVCPSLWMSKHVENSYVSNRRCVVINNGINLDIFKPTNSDFRKKYNLIDKYVILGVANKWSNKKGLDTFIKLSSEMDDRYAFVLVGTNKEVDNILPNNIISIHKTYDQKELAAIYTTSDLYLNPTVEDNFPTVNIESLACGTPVLTYNTGGSPEIIDDTCGCVVEKGSISKLKEEIERICVNKPYSKESCLNKAKQFNAIDKYKEYIDLYKEMIENE